MALQLEYQSAHQQAVELAQELFIKHRIINYSFGFDRAVNRAGQCDFRLSLIHI